MAADPSTSPIPRWFREPPRARVIETASIPRALAGLGREVSLSAHGALVAVVDLSTFSSADALISEMLDSLAGLARALWPAWYGGVLSLELIDPVLTPDQRRASRELERLIDPRWRTEISASWFLAARERVRAGEPPLIPSLPPSAQARQLGLAIGGDRLTPLLILWDRSPESSRLLVLARVAEWLASETRSRVLVMVHEGLANCRELDGINYQAIRWDDHEDHVTEPGLNARADAPPPSIERKDRLWPIQGRPHPLSPGELRLADALARDELLGPLFQFNMLVTADSRAVYCVDLLWAVGKLVVEIDGYEYHSSRWMFSADRRRDHDLLISGYLVMRIPHDEVLTDTTAAVEKIRRLVLFRKRPT